MSFFTVQVLKVIEVFGNGLNAVKQQIHQLTLPQAFACESAAEVKPA